VRNRDGSVVPVVSLSPVLAELPVSRNEYVFAAPELRDDVEGWLASERESITARAFERQAAEESLGDEREEDPK